jgi:hypothetical protein
VHRGLESQTSAASDLQPRPSPSGFFPFGCIKGKLSHCNSENRKDLLNAITEILNGMNQEVLLSVFEPWTNRPKWEIKREAKYSTKKRKKKRLLFKIGKENGRRRTQLPRYPWREALCSPIAAHCTVRKEHREVISAGKNDNQTHARRHPGQRLARHTTSRTKVYFEKSVASRSLPAI